MQKHAFSVLALTILVAPAFGSGAAAEGDNVATLRSQVADLQKQVQALTASSGEQWLTEQRAEEIRGLVHDVLADADTRASLLQSGVNAGYDKNFFIGSADGNYLLKVSGQVQIRWVYNMQDDDSGDDDDRWGFENRRTKVRFAGHVFDPTWQYNVLGAFDRDGGSFVLDEGFITKDLENGWKIRLGQFKLPFLREELVSSSKQLAVERSLVNEEFNQDRAQGVEASYTADQWRVAMAYSDGFFPGGVGTDNTAWSAEDTEWAFTGRAEFLAMGTWNQFDDMSGWRGDETGVLIGAAIHYQNDEYGTSAPFGNDAEVEALHLTGDVSVDLDGVGLYAALVYRNLDSDAAAADLDQLGFVIQGGFFISEDWELFGRYEWGDFDIAGLEDLSVLTVGVTKYWDRHNLKWSSDVGFALDPVEAVWASDGAGWRTDSTDEDGQVVIRSQLQLLF